MGETKATGWIVACSRMRNGENVTGSRADTKRVMNVEQSLYRFSPVIGTMIAMFLSGSPRGNSKFRIFQDLAILSIQRWI